MPPPLSAALRRIIRLKLESGEKDRAIIGETSISVRQMRKMRRNWERYGEVVRPTKKGGRPRILSCVHEEQLLLLQDQRPTASLDDMQRLLRDQFDLDVNECTISRTLKRLTGHRKESIRVANPCNVTSGQIPPPPNTAATTSNDLLLDPSLSTTFHLPPTFSNNNVHPPPPPPPLLSPSPLNHPPPSFQIPLHLQHLDPLTPMSSPPLFGLILPPRPVHTTPLIISPTQCAFTLPFSSPITYLIVFLLPNALLPPDTLAGVYIQLPPRAGGSSSSSSSSGAFTLLGALGNDKPSAIFTIDTPDAPPPPAPEDDMIDIDAARPDLTVGISIEPAATLAPQLAILDPMPTTSSALVLAARGPAPPLPTKVLAQRIIRNAFNFLASFAGSAPGANAGGEEVVPLRSFREWWAKFERRVENDPGFLEREGDG